MNISPWALLDQLRRLRLLSDPDRNLWCLFSKNREVPHTVPGNGPDSPRAFEGESVTEHSPERASDLSQNPQISVHDVHVSLHRLAAPMCFRCVDGPWWS